MKLLERTRHFILRLLCPHHSVLMRPGAHHAKNWDNKMRIQCAHCGKVWHQLGRTIYPYVEKQCYYDKVKP
jgi:hypothetical protein